MASPVELALQIACESPTREALLRDFAGIVDRTLGPRGILVIETGASFSWSELWQARVPAAHLTRLRRRWGIYGRELAPVLRVAEREGAAVDKLVLGDRYERTRYYQESVAPRHNTTLTGMLRRRGRTYGAVVLGRERFTASDCQLFKALVPALALGLKTFDALQVAPGPPELLALSPRDRDLVEYVRLGFTNPEIANALGISRNTVRNRLHRIFDVVGASTRAELAALASTMRRP